MQRLIQLCVFGKTLVLMAMFAEAQAPKRPPPPPVQPVPFSHKQHAGVLKLKCNMCHPNKDPGESMGVVATTICMQCHSSVKTDTPAIQKVAASAKENRPLKWARVYEIPTYVNFSHRSHVTAGATCNDCHGQVAE